MKRVLPALIISACVLLLAFSAQALKSASEALSLWLERVLPALFPFYVLTSLLFRCGVFDRLQTRFHSPLPACFFIGSVAGNPTGARICSMMGRPAYAAPCNLCSPAFLLGVVSVNLCGNAGFFWPLAIAHYTSALLSMVCIRMFERGTDQVKPPEAEYTLNPKDAGGWLNDISDGMNAMLQIGGCIVFFYVLSNTAANAVLRGGAPVLSAVVIGLTEMTAGCRCAAKLALPLNVKVGMLAFFTSFGGVCVFAQSMMTAQLREPKRYLLQKLGQGSLAALTAYFILPWFPVGTAAVYADRAETYTQNALIGATFVASMGLGLLTCYIAARFMQRGRANG